jgi:hypothetical protein
MSMGMEGADVPELGLVARTLTPSDTPATGVLVKYNNNNHDTSRCTGFMMNSYLLSVYRR